jgi:hypothetical protein
MTETLEQYRGRMEHELTAANNVDLLKEVQAVQRNRGWTFDRSWSHVLATQPAYQRNSSTSTSLVAAKERSYAMVEARAHALIRESGGRMTMSEALSRARKGEPEQARATSQPAEPVKNGRMLLIRGSEGTYVD